MNLSTYPQALQILMQTDGTVTELIKLLAKEEVNVVKLSEERLEETNHLLRKIFLQGKCSGKYWMYAESTVFLDNLPQDFVNDLIDKTIPIGTLWMNYRMETFKQPIQQGKEVSLSLANLFHLVDSACFLTRTYQVFSGKKIIMEITEKFPVDAYSS